MNRSVRETTQKQRANDSLFLTKRGDFILVDFYFSKIVGTKE